MERDFVLRIKNVNHGFDNNRVLCDINIDIVRGEIVALVGPSGCGKSTLLRAIVGTHPPREGSILVHPRSNGGRAVPVQGPGRDRGIVYQQYTLFPFLTAQQNVAVGLMLDETSIPFRFFAYPMWRRIRKRHMELAAEALKRVELEHAMALYPTSMSGGMRQRVAVAQALVMKPEILLMDEPFGALDEATREDLQRMLLTLYVENSQALAKGQKPPYTVIIVTHEIYEAIYVGDRVVGVSPHWDWKAENQQSCPGATVVYDRAVPVELPGEERHYEAYAKQRAEILNVVFNPTANMNRHANQTFWEQVNDGKAEGIFGGIFEGRTETYETRRLRHEKAAS